jgi:very-short-patch-repair endonuclease
LGRKIPVNLAKNLRKKQTETEALLWSKLRDRQLMGLKFRRQQSIGNYVIDFACMDKNLLIEIDGGQHNTNEKMEKDADRTLWLEEKGYQILRFWNNDITDNLDGVIEVILHSLIQKSPPHSNSLPRRREDYRLIHDFRSRGERIGG